MRITLSIPLRLYGWGFQRIAQTQTVTIGGYYGFDADWKAQKLGVF